MLYKKLLILCCFILLNNCSATTLTKNKNYNSLDNPFINKGFSLIYNDRLYNDKIISKKIDERSLVIFQKNLKKNTIVKITNILNNKSLIAKPKKARVTNLGATINTVYPEYSPVISLDGTSLYFTSRRQWADKSTDDYKDAQLNQYPEDIYVSYLDLNKKLSNPEKLSFCDGKTLKHMPIFYKT